MLQRNNTQPNSTVLLLQDTGLHPQVSKKIEAHSRNEALLLFEEAKKRLNDINNWHRLCDERDAVFQLTDPTGKPVFTTFPERGDLIRILLSGIEGDLATVFAWVRIEGFEQGRDTAKDEEFYGFRVRAVRSPHLLKDKKAGIYISDIINTFLVIRKRNKVEAVEKESEAEERPLSWLGKIRSMLNALSVFLGISRPHWKKLVYGLIPGKA